MATLPYQVLATPHGTHEQNAPERFARSSGALKEAVRVSLLGFQNVKLEKQLANGTWVVDTTAMDQLSARLKKRAEGRDNKEARALSRLAELSSALAKIASSRALTHEERAELVDAFRMAANAAADEPKPVGPSTSIKGTVVESTGKPLAQPIHHS